MTPVFNAIRTVRGADETRTTSDLTTSSTPAAGAARSRLGGRRGARLQQVAMPRPRALASKRQPLTVSASRETT